MIRNTVSAFTVPSQEERKSFLSLEKTPAVHAEKLASLACLNTVRVGGAAGKVEALAFPFAVAAWNLERCLFPEESAAKLRETGAPLILLSEMDLGMARTEQRDPTAIIASELGMNHAYGVEFLELSLGSEIERSYCRDDFNEKGFHGNALMASVALKDAFMIRLPGEAVWFNDSNEQPRIGDRCAVGAIVTTEAGPMVAVSVHLESVATAAYRERQLAALIDEVEAFAPGLPILIGGDLNTGNHTGGDYSTDTLFAMAESRGFECHGGPLDQTSTRPSLITRFPDRAMKLDWFITRGLKIGESHLVSSLNGEGKPLSDHDMVVCTIEGFSA
ncbi:endonuclease/exonuclease/phosphatase family protein [Rhizobium miluonense]|jgi:endonuclease/exonuclease/phosphatase family metal-dependent hydrolase|uniref:Endonuclease/exonuclease/phosphatase family metal-dependent hydrolase n=1 Tax=Rhizobium miluonense TaxID=411945 RepID=A0ABU1SI15_9HYPH|nr:endonuclease/exonuclease/phosphatase family protein [Rhizobium miluonense]MDR6898642.1 endonuclease/exonuclease/phosphatase family metal-dependent hydrolase [Rhizobium miluonense]